MAWRRRRKQPMSLLTFLCASCGLIFVFGNLLLLHDGFVQIYENTLKDIPRNLGEALGGISRGGKDYAVGHVGLPHSDSIQLPAAAFAAETPLRKLMEDHPPGNSSRSTSSSMWDIMREDSPLYRDAQSQRLHMLTVTPEDLSRTLAASSDCHSIQGITNRTYLASGWTKAVYSATYRGHRVALKTVDPAGFEVTECQKEYGLDKQNCQDKASQKILKEILLLQSLKHKHIVEVYGHCVPEPGESGEVSMVTELGESIDLIKLLQMSWEDRLRISYGITRLLKYLAHSPLGSVLLNDFRRQQFVMVEGELKLTDIDDMGFGEEQCSTDDDCQHYFSAANYTLKTTCQQGLCEGFNEKKNIFNAARHFTSFLLPHGAPPTLKDTIEIIVSGYGNATVTSGDLASQMNVLVQRYVSGEYLMRDTIEDVTTYVEYPASDLPGRYDYRCRYSVASSGCTVSVFDKKEAEEMCDLDPDCQGYVFSSDHTWTGRTIIHLKNGFGPPSPNPSTTLYVKPSTLLLNKTTKQNEKTRR